MKLSIASLLVLTLAAASAAAGADFDSLTHAGFSVVSETAALIPAAPPKAVPAGGVYLHSWLQGRLFHCSASGCVLLRARGASRVVSSGQGGVYFSGQGGTGYCDPGGCRLLLPGQDVTFPLSAGPRGDIWAANRIGGWHCTPSSCLPAFSGAMQGGLNDLPGVYKAGGDFAASNDQGTFWCAGDRCRKVSDRELLFVEASCSGVPPADASFAFSGRIVYRCSAAGCRALGEDAAVDNYADCRFDSRGRLLLPRRGPDGRPSGDSIACDAASCARDASAAPKRAYAGAGQDHGWTRGEDGARYKLADAWAASAPAAGHGDTLPPTITRADDSGRLSTLTADAACFQWLPGSSDDDGEDSPAWSPTCRLVK